MKKPFIIHWFYPDLSGKKSDIGDLNCRGVTILLEKKLDNVSIRAAFCNKRDDFSRKEGVKVASNKPETLCNRKDLIKELDKIKFRWQEKEWRTGKFDFDFLSSRDYKLIIKFLTGK